jgi:FG-GAP-like repeat
MRKNISASVVMVVLWIVFACAGRVEAQGFGNEIGVAGGVTFQPNGKVFWVDLTPNQSLTGFTIDGIASPLPWLGPSDAFAQCGDSVLPLRRYLVPMPIEYRDGRSHAIKIEGLNTTQGDCLLGPSTDSFSYVFPSQSFGHISHLSYYYAAYPGTSYLSEVRGHSNTAFVVAYDAPTLTPILAELLSEPKMNAIIALDIVAFSDNAVFGGCTLYTDWQARVNAYVAAALPYVNSGRVAAFFPRDEPAAGCVGNLELLIDYVKSLAPSVPHYINYGVSANGTWPRNVDWIGFDRYGFDNFNANYTNFQLLKSRLRGGQRIALVTDAYWPYSPDAGVADRTLSALADMYFDIAADPAVVAIVAFSWQALDRSYFGIRDLPKTRAKYTNFANTRLLLPRGAPVAARAPLDLSGDGKSDLIFQNGANGQITGWLMNGANSTAIASLLPPGNWTITHTGDFNGDGKADILFRNSDGSVALWLMNGLSSISTAGLIGPSAAWRVTHVADFNGDGKADILWRNSVDGTVAVWLMNGTTQISSTVLLTAPNWSVTHVADFNGDGKADLLWRNSVDGTVAAWLMNGGSLISGAGLLVAADWSVTHVGDFNGDGKADLIWRRTDGTTGMWLMNGLAASSTAGLLGANPDWSVTHVGDLNGDGKADVLWRNTNGSVTAWLMNGTSAASTAGIFGADPNWRITHLGDYNGDGKADLLWRNTTDGRIAMWLMNGTTTLSATGILGASSWTVVPQQ